METVTVELGTRSYRIMIENGLIGRAGTLLTGLALRKTTVVITNTTIAPLYLESLTGSLSAAGYTVHRIIIPDGEQHKNISQVEFIYDRLLSFDLDRRSPLIALGGGVVGDVTGFAASTFMRGVPFVQIPTTLLAQVDSSVGGKTGVNVPGAKNMVGTFHQPAAVLIDPDVLRTLDAREMQAGLAEVIKYGVIADKRFFSYLQKHLDESLALAPPALSHIISTCCSIKAQIISRDETEQGIRAHLNFGHTIGHAIETLTGYGTYMHGEAVAMGMAAAARLSSLQFGCPPDEASRVSDLLTKAGLPTKLPDFPASAYTAVIRNDKKKTENMVRMVVMKCLGDVMIRELSPGELTALLQTSFGLA